MQLNNVVLIGGVKSGTWPHRLPEFLNLKRYEGGCYNLESIRRFAYGNSIDRQTVQWMMKI